MTCHTPQVPDGVSAMFSKTVVLLSMTDFPLYCVFFTPTRETGTTSTQTPESLHIQTQQSGYWPEADCSLLTRQRGACFAPNPNCQGLGTRTSDCPNWRPAGDL